MLSLFLSMVEGPEDKNKFEELYLKYNKLMKHIAMDILHDEGLAEDAVHDAFLNLVRYIDKIEDISCHKTKHLIIIVIENVSKNLYNKRKKESIVDLSFDEEAVVDERFSFQDYDESAIIQEIMKLPSTLSGVLVLKYVNGYSNKEIAKILNVSAVVVRKRLERAKRTLKIALRQGGYL